jgi:hypothetical protein
MAAISAVAAVAAVAAIRTSRRSRQSPLSVCTTSIRGYRLKNPIQMLKSSTQMNRLLNRVETLENEVAFAQVGFPAVSSCILRLIRCFAYQITRLTSTDLKMSFVWWFWASLVW